MADDARRRSREGRTDPLLAGSRVVSKKWNVAVLDLVATEGPQGFNDIQEHLEGVSAKVLSDSLDDLQDHDVLERRVLSESPLRVEYDLTRSGRALVPVIDDLAEWADAHLIQEEPTVLVVDDDPRVADMHAEWIADQYDVTTAYSREAARSTAESGVDLVVVDHRLGSDGVAVTEELGGVADAPVLILSSLEPDLSVLEGRCAAYLRKPTDPSTLRDRVDGVLDRREFGSTVREYLALRSLRETVRESTSRRRREDDDRYAALETRITELEGRIDDERLAELVDRPVVDSA